MPRRNHRPHQIDRSPAAYDQPAEPAPAPLPLRRDSDAAQHLENLRAALSQVQPELYARLDSSPGHPPRLRVTNPARPESTEDIHHRAGPGCGDYVWSWAQVIGPTDDPVKAAACVLQVLEIRGRRM
jgi:hypothetical protein